MEPHEVPTHLDTETRILFGLLTPRQAVVVAVGVMGGLGLAAQLPDGLPVPVRAVPAVLGALLAVVWAFIRPLDRPLERWAGILLRHYTLPRRYLWRGGEEPERWVPAPTAARPRVVLPGDERTGPRGPAAPAPAPWSAADLPGRRRVG